MSTGYTHSAEFNDTLSRLFLFRWLVRPFAHLRFFVCFLIGFTYRFAHKTTLEQRTP